PRGRPQARSNWPRRDRPARPGPHTLEKTGRAAPGCTGISRCLEKSPCRRTEDGARGAAGRKLEEPLGEPAPSRLADRGQLRQWDSLREACQRAALEAAHFLRDLAFPPRLDPRESRPWDVQKRRSLLKPRAHHCVGVRVTERAARAPW